MKVIKLTRKVSFTNYQVLATIGIAEKKEFFHAIAELVGRENEQGNVNGKNIISQISSELLDRPDNTVMAKLLVDRLVSFDILRSNESTIELTTIGENLRATGVFFSLSKDVYELSIIANDSLLSPRIITLRTVPISFTENNTLVNYVKSKQKDKQKKSILNKNKVTLPQKFFVMKQKEFITFDGQRYRLESYEANGIISKRGSVNFSLEIMYSLKTNTSKVYARITNSTNKKSEIPVDLSFVNINYFDIKYILLNHSEYNYNRNDDIIYISATQFENLRKHEKQYFSLDVKISNATINYNGYNFGEYANIILKEEVIRPQDLNCAITWALFLLLEQITTYITEEEYTKICEEISRKSEFISFDISLPTWIDIVNNFEFGTSKYWYIQANKDLIEVIQ